MNSSRLADFFITCSGANKKILQECEGERSKFAGIGATIFLTALMACISGGYALYFTFNNIFISIAFGIFWGIIIFNLDRVLVAGIRKKGNIRKELLMAIPRFLIAIILGLTISKPLEIKLFDGSITTEMGRTEDKYNKACEESFNDRRKNLDDNKSDLEHVRDSKKNALFSNDKIYTSIKDQKQIKVSENMELLKRIAHNNDDIIKNSWLEEITNNTGRMKTIRKYNDRARNKMNENKQLRATIQSNEKLMEALTQDAGNRQANLTSQVQTMEAQYAKQIAGVQQQIDMLNAQRADILKKCKEDAASDKDILSRLRALSNLKSFGNSVWWASLLITLLFVFLELAPITAKLLSPRGSYEEILDRIEHEIYLQQQEIISEKNNEANNLLNDLRSDNELKEQIRIKTQKEKIDIELQSNNEITKYISEKQVSLVKKSIDEWYDNELKKNGSDTAKHNGVIQLENNLYEKKHSGSKEYYFFGTDKNQLLYFDNGNVIEGTWKYTNMNEEVFLELRNKEKRYKIAAVNDKAFNLIDVNGTILELTKV